ncbi:MAG: hypothetical protein HY867_01975 [Chloroflexi bacterium]|nr:hypothetical protein [Chloroflexota bacterium]
MTASSVPFIRPLTLGQLLDQAIGLYRRNFAAFIGIIAIPYIPLTLLQSVISYFSMDSAASILTSPPLDSTSPFGLPSGYWAGVAGMFVVAFIQFILVNGVATAAFTRAVANNYTGQSIGVIDSYRQLGNSWVRLVGAILLAMLIGIPIFIWLIVPCIGWFTGPGLFSFFSLVVIPLTAPIIVLERHSITASLRRAWDLGRTRFWWLIGFALVIFLLGQLIITGPTFVISAILQAIFLRDGNTQAALVWRPVVQMLVQMSGGLLYLPLQLTAMTLVYFDLRVRSEGLDLALQAAAESGTETNIVALAETSPAPTGDFITGQDALNFFLLSIGIVALYFLFVGLFVGLFMLIAAVFA